MIKVENIVKTFDGFRALDGLNLNVPKGGIYGLVGPNGSGKSTVIRHITGIYRQDSGIVTVDGQPVYENTDLKRRSAYISDDVYAFLSANIGDMRDFYRGMYPHFDMQRFEALREAFPLDEKKAIRHLSKGMQKQAAFWLAMCCRPDYLILDEPVDGLDPVMRRRVWSILMGDVADHGTTVLVSLKNTPKKEARVIWEKRLPVVNSKITVHINKEDSDLREGIYWWDARILFNESEEPYTPMEPAPFRVLEVVGNV